MTADESNSSPSSQMPSEEGKACTASSHELCYELFYKLRLNRGGCHRDIQQLIHMADQLDHHLAQSFLTRLYYFGTNYTPRSEQIAMEYAQRSAGWLVDQVVNHSNDQYVLGNLGYFYHGGMGVEKNFEYAVQCYRSAADQGNVLALTNLAGCYENGVGVARDVDQARRCYLLAAERGKALGRKVLKASHQTSAVLKAHEVFNSFLMDAKQEGRPEAKFVAGSCLRHGIGTLRDDLQAYKYIRSSARQGHECALQALATDPSSSSASQSNQASDAFKLLLSISQHDAMDAASLYHLSLCFICGLGVEKDEAEAVRYCRLAADQDHPAAQYQMGVYCEEGRYVSKSEAHAVRYYQLSADQGYAQAQNGLAHCYQLGIGVVRNAEEAVRYYRLAAAQGLPLAMHNVGMCYESGLGVEESLSIALNYYQLASDGGHTPAGDRLEALKNLIGNMKVIHR